MTRPWTAPDWTPDLAYLIGAYLTDGWISRDYVYKQPSTFTVSVVSTSFADRVELALKQVMLPVSRKVLTTPHQDQHAVRCYNSAFCRWLLWQCIDKEHIPADLEFATDEAKLEFLAAIIDGDGHVTNIGAIRIRSTNGWINDLPSFLDDLDIRHAENVDSILPDGKPYHCVSIRRSDYVELDGTCYVPEKAERIANAKDTRVRTPKRHTAPCRLCGTLRPVRTKGAVGLCWACHINQC